MRILIADDDPASRRFLEYTLTRLGHEVESTADGPEAIAALLRADAPRIAIIDWEMPGADGLVVCRVARHKEEPYVYVILLTARNRREDMLLGLAAGADDFLSKPVDLGELQARLRSGERILALQQGLMEARETLRIQATSDDLTGLATRRVIVEQLDRELRRARHERKPVAVAMADIDCFKLINDRYGHLAGDAVLRQVARCIQVEVREYDGVGRFGGEEFMFVLPGCDAEAAAITMERVRARIKGTPVPWEGESIAVAISTGVASTAPDGLSAAELIQAADDALYRAKARGRDCVAVWAPEPPAQAPAPWMPTAYQVGTGFPGHATAPLALLAMAG